MKKNSIVITAIILTFVMGMTCIACDSEKKEQKQESTTEVKNIEKKTMNNKKENKKVHDKKAPKKVLAESKVEPVKISTDKENKYR